VKCSALLIDDRNRIASSGYNGETKNLRNNDDPLTVVHSEQNTLIWSKNDLKREKDLNYICNRMPCTKCASLHVILNVDVQGVYFLQPLIYPETVRLISKSSASLFFVQEIAYIQGRMIVDEQKLYEKVIGKELDEKQRELVAKLVDLDKRLAVSEKSRELSQQRVQLISELRSESEFSREHKNTIPTEHAVDPVFFINVSSSDKAAAVKRLMEEKGSIKKHEYDEIMKLKYLTLKDYNEKIDGAFSFTTKRIEENIYEIRWNS